MAAASVRDPQQVLETHPVWYHTFDLPGGVTTRGLFDHRPVVAKLPLPASLEGKRCLDLASADGFFAFEMARRGGRVTSVDLEDPAGRDWQGSGPRENAPTGTGARARFEAAKALTGLEVARVDMNLYDVSPEALGGTFDFVFMGNVLLHVSDPARVLRRVRSVTRGQFLCFETVSLWMTVAHPFGPSAVLGRRNESRWWTPNLRAHRRLLEATEFEVIAGGFPVFQPFGRGTGRRPRELPWRTGNPLGWLAFWTATRWFGVPSAWTLCR